MNYNITNYIDFLVDLWKITKKDGGFNAFSALISKHGVSKSMSVVLCDDLEWVSDDGALYVWRRNKPTKKDAETAYLMLKSRLEKQKKEKAKRDALGIGKPGKKTTVIYTSDKTTPLVEEIAKLDTEKTNNLVSELTELGKAIDNMPKAIVNDNYTNWDLEKDVKEVLQVTAEEVAVSKRLYTLQEDYAKLHLQLETERKISFDEIDRLSAANQALELQYINLTEINSGHRQTILEDGEKINVLENRLNQATKQLDISNASVAELKKQLAELKEQLNEANTKIESTLKYKIKSWLRK